MWLARHKAETFPPIYSIPTTPTAPSPLQVTPSWPLVAPLFLFPDVNLICTGVLWSMDETISTTDPPKPVCFTRSDRMHVRWPAGQRNLSYSKMFRPTPESTQPPMQCVRGVIWPAVKMLWHEVDQSPTSSARATNETLLYLHHHPPYPK